MDTAPERQQLAPKADEEDGRVEAVLGLLAEAEKKVAARDVTAGAGME